MFAVCFCVQLLGLPLCVKDPVTETIPFIFHSVRIVEREYKDEEMGSVKLGLLCFYTFSQNDLLL